MTLKEFSNVYFDWKSEQTSMPCPKRDRFTDSTEKGLVLCIKAHAKMNGWESLVYDAKGSWSKSLNRYVYSKMDLGRPDIYIFIPAGNGLAKVIAIDIKMEGDKQQPRQEEYMKETMARGNAYFMPENWAEYYEKVMQIVYDI